LRFLNAPAIQSIHDTIHGDFPMNRFLLSLTALAATAALSTGAAAQSTIKAGTLTCTGGQGVGLILGSLKSYACHFVPANGQRGESYQATVTRLGVDVGVTGKTTMIWTVLAATDTLAPRALAGAYGGAAADASIGVGAGAKALVGGSQNSVALQPVSVQGQTGVNLAVGVAGLSLR
jgi:Protein of unknown function (DUF992)